MRGCVWALLGTGRARAPREMGRQSNEREQKVTETQRRRANGYELRRSRQQSRNRVDEQSIGTVDIPSSAHPVVNRRFICTVSSRPPTSAIRSRRRLSVRVSALTRWRSRPPAAHSVHALCTACAGACCVGGCACTHACPCARRHGGRHFRGHRLLLHLHVAALVAALMAHRRRGCLPRRHRRLPSALARGGRDTREQQGPRASAGESTRLPGQCKN